MHNTTEIEKSLEDYPLIPMDDIEDEARLLAVRWVEGYEPAGFDLPNKHKLASDIMNYAKRRKLNSDSTAENKGQQKEMKWVKAIAHLPKEDSLYNAKYRDEPVIIRVREGVIDRLTFASGGVFSNPAQATLDDTEWLEESPTYKPEELQEELERLRDALKFFTDDNSYSVYDAVDDDFKLHREIAKQALNQK